MTKDAFKIVNSAVSAAAPGAPSYVRTDAERALWPYFAPHAEAQHGMWFDVSRDSLYRALSSDGLPADAKIKDRCGGRIFTPAPVRNVHPLIVTDSETGLPCLMFGEGTNPGRELNTDFTGAMDVKSIIKNGVETNMGDFFATGTGLSFAFKARLPDDNATVNGYTFGTYSGGSVFGGQGTAGPLIGFNDGRFSFRTQIGESNFSSGVVDSARDDAWHTYVGVYKPSTGTVNLWIDGVAQTSGPITEDFDPSTGTSGVPMFGATDNSIIPAARFVGFLSCAFAVRGAVFDDTAARAAVIDYMATL